MTEGPPAPGDSFDLETEPAEGHMAAEGIEPAEPERPFWYRALRNSDPNPPIEQVGGFHDLREQWQSYGIRGLQKLGGVDDTEAWVDLVKFAIGFMLEQADEMGEDEQEMADRLDVDVEGEL